MTEQTGQNSEVLPDLPAMHAEADSQPGAAPVVPQHDPDESAVPEAALPEPVAEMAEQADPYRLPEPDASAPVAEE